MRSSFRLLPPFIGVHLIRRLHCVSAVIKILGRKSAAVTSACEFFRHQMSKSSRLITPTAVKTNVMLRFLSHFATSPEKKDPPIPTRVLHGIKIANVCLACART